MNIDAKKLKLFENISEISFDNNYYDFHNDFDCTKISLEKKSLLLNFRHIENNYIITLKFNEVILDRLDFNLLANFDSTIDTVY